MTVEKPKPKQLLRPITRGTNSAMNQSQSRVHGVIGFGFASHWLKNWRDPFGPITKRSNRNHVITFDSQLKTALLDEISLPNFSLSCTVPAWKSNIGGACIIINSQWRKWQLKKEKKGGGGERKNKKTKTPGVECALCDNYEMSSLFFTALLY